jgi:hypothetical protein
MLGNIMLLFYLVGSALTILLLSLYKKRGEVTPILLLALMQFAFGNIAGSFLFLYGKSGTFEGSSLFLLILGLFVVGNEFMRERYSRVNFHISTWYFLSFLYLTLVIPMITEKMGDLIFVSSGVISLILAVCFGAVLFLISKDLIGEIKKIILSVAGIFIFLNALYFLNVIPPVPLSLSEIGIYHLVVKTDEGVYKTLYEEPKWYEFYRETNKQYTMFNETGAYCFTSILAPAKLSTGINHRWDYYDEISGKWRTSALISFPITGGRDNGYRGYSQKSNLSPGYWRCSAETITGALIGRTTFTVINSLSEPLISEKER